MAIFKKRIWITGNGFLGKNFERYLKKYDYEIFLTERKTLDLRNYVKVKKFILNNQPNVILQTAGKVGGIIRNKKEKFELLNDNIIVSSNIISASNEVLKDIKFLNFPSSCIYPNNKKRRITEEDFKFNNIEESSANYALAKIVSYEMCNALFFQNKQYINVIPSNLYGPFDNFNPDESHVIPGLIYKMLNTYDDLYLPGSGLAKRDFLYIEDFIGAVKKIIDAKKVNFPSLNISSNEIITIKKLVDKIKKHTNYKNNIYFKKDGLDGTLYKCLSSKRIRKVYTWKEKVNLDKGIYKTIKWLKSKSQ